MIPLMKILTIISKINKHSTILMVWIIRTMPVCPFFLFFQGISKVEFDILDSLTQRNLHIREISTACKAVASYVKLLVQLHEFWCSWTGIENLLAGRRISNRLQTDFMVTCLEGRIPSIQSRSQLRRNAVETHSLYEIIIIWVHNRDYPDSRPCFASYEFHSPQTAIV